eukprot:2732514-Alexandrium_andersonii.AAC.1
MAATTASDVRSDRVERTALLKPFTREISDLRLQDPVVNRDLITAIKAFDSVELGTFRGLLEKSPATMGGALSSTSSSRVI